MRTRRVLVLLTVWIVAAGLLLVPAASSGAPRAGGSRPAADHETTSARLHRYAAATWRSFTAMVDTSSGLPTDQL